MELTMQEDQTPLSSYHSKYRSLSLTLAPEEVGFTKDFKGNEVPFENLNFVDGQLHVFDKDVDEAIKKHSGLGSVFERVQDGLINWDKPNGEIRVDSSDSTEEELERVNTLFKYSKMKGFNPKAHIIIVEMLEKVVQHYNVSNFKIPSPDKKQRVLKSSIVLLLDALEEKGIWKESDEGSGDFGSSKNSDQTD